MGKLSIEITVLLQGLCSLCERTLTDVDHVWNGYTEASPCEPILVAMSNKERHTACTKFQTFEVIFRTIGQVSSEAEYVAKQELDQGLEFSAAERSDLLCVLRKHTEFLMSKHSNLKIVSASKLKSRHYGQKNHTIQEQTCIVLYVPVKGVIPFQEEPFPTEIEGYPVDVREGLFFPYTNPNESYKRLMVGCQIHSAYGTSGTLGGFVQLSSGNIGCLTCWHMFLSDKSEADLARDTFKADVFQSDLPNTLHKFGAVIDHVYYPGDHSTIGMDAALIEVTDSDHLPKGFLTQERTGKVLKDFKDIPSQCKVFKNGFKTGHTEGKLRLLGSSVDKQPSTYKTGSNPSGMYQLHQQIEFFPLKSTSAAFSQDGDSGSLVFLANNRESDEVDIVALGILVGGTSYNSAIVTPIWAILERFKLPMQLLAFKDKEEQATQAGAAGSVLSKQFKSGLPEKETSTLKSDVTILKNDMIKVKEDISNIKTAIADMKARMDTSDREFETINENLRALLSKLV